MASSIYLFMGLAILYAATADAQLFQSFYAKSCPGGVQAVANLGCDGSVLLASTPGNKAEKDAPSNLSLQGFGIIDQAKAALERTCPGVFSCSDILALAARDAISTIGGPSWTVPLGRRDGTISRASAASSNLPGDGFSFRQLLQNFNSKGLSQSDLIVLSGAHTIGLTHCSEVTPRIYNFPRSASGADPYVNITYVTEKRGVCPNSASSANKFVTLDSSKGGQTFDINYFTNVLDHKAIFKSDDALISTSSGLKQVLDLVRSPSSKFSANSGWLCRRWEGSRCADWVDLNLRSKVPGFVK
ncbi:hypothetical protein AXG93_4846s1120 [Marchantia polymorpha subsp. ruderalis]|uniref:Peroxidase n=1 Tax=Marchantia polymorpha subsp. ruderalis TaxID=1480154 RepID=A0A176VEI2_MARPO|nr:hypothetical protein AXG93_4846s1120 [Marchantia polymorpha subsp. ruderalis]